MLVEQQFKDVTTSQARLVLVERSISGEEDVVTEADVDVIIDGRLIQRIPQSRMLKAFSNCRRSPYRNLKQPLY